MSFREFSDYAEWEQAAEDMGYELVPPYVDVENGPSSADPYETTIAIDRLASEEVGLFTPGEYVYEGDYGILFTNPNDFARWQHEGDNDPENYV